MMQAQLWLHHFSKLLLPRLGGSILFFNFLFLSNMQFCRMIFISYYGSLVWLFFQQLSQTCYIKRLNASVVMMPEFLMHF